jgi:hypothetical protein
LNTVHQLLDAAAMHGVALDPAFLEMAIRRRMEQIAEDFQQRPTELEALQRLEDIAGLLVYFPFEIYLRTVQNVFYHIRENDYPQMKKKARRREKAAVKWVDTFQALGKKIGVRAE